MTKNPASTSSVICEALAKAAGVTWVERLKEQALAHDIDPSSIPMAMTYALLREAPHNIEAHRALANAGVLMAVFGDEQQPADTLLQALIFARLAAVQSGSHRDKDRVATMLAMAANRSSGDEANHLAGECVAWLEVMADEGDEAAIDLIGGYAAYESADVLTVARSLKPLIQHLWQ